VTGHDTNTIAAASARSHVLNEFIAYAQLARSRRNARPAVVHHSRPLRCAAFANLSPVGIQIGGIGALAPNRKHDLAKLGFRAMIGRTLANFLSATLAGMLL